MAKRFFVKRFPNIEKFDKIIDIKSENKDINEEVIVYKEEEKADVTVEIVETLTSKKNKKGKKNEIMTNFNDKFSQAEEMLAAMEPEVKIVKNDRGLIERTESSKIILTEDNKQLLVD